MIKRLTTEATHVHLDAAPRVTAPPVGWSRFDWSEATLAAAAVGDGPDGAARLNTLVKLAAASATGGGAPARPRVHDVAYLASRLGEEMSRYDLFGQPFALMGLRRPVEDGESWFSEESVNVVQAVCLLKRPPDVFNWISAGTLVLLMPHTGLRQARYEQERLCGELRGLAPGWVLSVLVYPADTVAIERLPVSG
jgi:hypothetical protein